MQKYSDFALPNLENIEQMAKAYKNAVIEKNKLLQGEKQLLYENVFKLCAIIKFLFSKHKQNNLVVKMFQLSNAIMLKVEGILFEENIVGLKGYSIDEKTILLECSMFGIEIVKTYLNNKNNAYLCSVSNDVCEILTLLYKYYSI